MAAGDENVPRIIKRGLPSAVTYDLSHADSVKITLPQGSVWSSGLHWHAAHTEYLKVIQGSIQVRLNNITQIIEATPDNQPELKVEPYAWHEWRRAHTSTGGEVIVVERTDPADGDKAIFFWNLNGVILNAPKLLEESRLLKWISQIPVLGLYGKILDLWVTVNLFSIFYHLDNIPVVCEVSKVFNGVGVLYKLCKIVDYLLSYVFLYLVLGAGVALGARPIRLAYTPAMEFAKWMDRAYS